MLQALHSWPRSKRVCHFMRAWQVCEGLVLSLRVLWVCRCDNEGSVGWEDSVRGAAMRGSAQLAKPHQKLESRLLRPCALETDSQGQAAA